MDGRIIAPDEDLVLGRTTLAHRVYRRAPRTPLFNVVETVTEADCLFRSNNSTRVGGVYPFEFTSFKVHLRQH